MKRSSSRRVGHLTAWLILLANAAFCVAPCRTEISVRQCEALSGLANMTLPPPEATDTILDYLGYSAERRPSNWSELAPLRKWEVAWISAEHGTPPYGGSRLISDAASFLSKRYESASVIIGPPKLLLGQLLTPLTFEPFRPTSDVIPEQVSHTLRLLVEYSSGFGGIYGVLMDGLGLSEREASEAVQDSTSREDALVLGILKVPPESRELRIRKTVSRIDELYPKTALEHRELDLFRRNPPERLPGVTGVGRAAEKDAWNEWKEFLLKGLLHHL